MIGDMMTLTDFLLARIAEDEAGSRDDFGAQAAHRNDCGIHPQGLEETACDCDMPQRMLAECEAKRRIVEGYLLRCEQGQDPRGEVFGYHATGMLIAVKLLAAVHADHPDYQEEWRL
jgi:hypothetical protein